MDIINCGDKAYGLTIEHLSGDKVQIIVTEYNGEIKVMVANNKFYDDHVEEGAENFKFVKTASESS